MRQYLRFLYATAFASLLFHTEHIMAQALEQDCFNATPVCQNTYQQTNSYVGPGNNPNEINTSFSCLEDGEQNDVWYIVTVQSPGFLSFTITPVDMNDDYDWAVYNLTTASCSDIAINPALEVSCNWSGTVGLTGPNLPGGPNRQGGLGIPFNAPIPVSPGETYAINVSNYTGSLSGYTIDLASSTAQIFDNVQPEMDTLTQACDGNINISFSENVECSSLDPTDFSITGPGGPYTITAITSANCTSGGGFDDEFLLELSPAISTSGTYFVSIINSITDNCGNGIVLGTDSLDVFVPTLDPMASPDTLCEGEITTLSLTPQAGVSYTWSGGLTGSSVNVNPASSTNYTCFATDANGCVTTATVNVHVWANPTSGFSTSATQTCTDLPLTLNFTGTADPSAVFDWDLGGGQLLSGSGSGPLSASWDTPGAFDISLTVTQNGCPNTISETITVSAIPSADFSGPADACVNGLANYNYTGNASPTANFFWDFDGAIPVSGTGAGPYQVEWAVPGPKMVTLTVEENGCTSATNSLGLTIHGLPVVSIDPAGDQCLNNNHYNFSYTSPANGTDFSWDFGDSSATSSLPNPTHTYTSSGPRSVSLTFTDDQGCVSTARTSFEVYPNVSADFDYEAVCFGQSTPFTDLSVAPASSPITSWQWGFDRNSSASDPNPGFTFPESGNHNVQLIITSVQGCSDTISQNIEVHDRPEALFEAQSACQGFPVIFTNTSTSSDPDLSYLWDFGDQSNSDLMDPEHIYPIAGTYEVNLTVAASNGCQHQITNTVTVQADPDAPTVLSDTTCFGENAFLVSEPAPLTEKVDWFYNKSDNNSFHEGFSYITPPLAYAQTYYVESVNDFGCRSERIPITAFLFENATGKIQMSDTVLDIPDALLGVQLSGNIKSKSFQWNFGDGNTSNEAQATHQYQRPGKYIVSLEVKSLEGCDYVLQSLVEVKELIVVHIPSAFSPNGDGINDEFHLGSQLIEQVDFQVFNRWGSKVFQASQPDFRWNGRKDKGGWAEEGVYTYILKGIDIHGKRITKSGTITLYK